MESYSIMNYEWLVKSMELKVVYLEEEDYTL